MSGSLWHEEHPNWAGESATYAAIHRRLTSWLGRAADHACCACGKPAQNWAYDHRDKSAKVSPHGLTYSTIAAHYQPMCIPCHRYLDADHKGQARCGTDAGYYRHRRRHESTCQRCRDAHKAATYARQARLTEYEEPTA